jgi:hypothetical protein
MELVFVSSYVTSNKMGAPTYGTVNLQNIRHKLHVELVLHYFYTVNRKRTRLGKKKKYLSTG